MLFGRLGVRHLDGAGQVVGHHHGEERGASPVQRREAVGSAASGFRRARGVNEEVYGAPAEYRACNNRRSVHLAAEKQPTPADLT